MHWRLCMELNLPPATPPTLQARRRLLVLLYYSAIISLFVLFGVLIIPDVVSGLGFLGGVYAVAVSVFLDGEVPCTIDRRNATCGGGAGGRSVERTALVHLIA